MSALISQSAFSFINIESLRQSDDMGLLGSIGLSANGASGNTDKFSTSTGINNIYRNENHEFLLILKHSYSEVSGDKNINKGQVHGRYTTKLANTLHSEIFSQIEFDDFKSLKNRKLFGIGLRAKLESTDVIKLAGGFGVFYESEEFNDETRNILYRCNFYISLKAKLNESSELTFVNYYQPSTDDVENYRLKSNLNLNLKVYKKLTFTHQVGYSFDSNLKAPIEKGDLVYKAGFGLKY